MSSSVHHRTKSEYVHPPPDLARRSSGVLPQADVKPNETCSRGVKNKRAVRTAIKKSIMWLWAHGLIPGWLTERLIKHLGLKHD